MSLVLGNLAKEKIVRKYNHEKQTLYTNSGPCHELSAENLAMVRKYNHEKQGHYTLTMGSAHIFLCRFAPPPLTME